MSVKTIFDNINAVSADDFAILFKKLYPNGVLVPLTESVATTNALKVTNSSGNAAVGNGEAMMNGKNVLVSNEIVPLPADGTYKIVLEWSAAADGSVLKALSGTTALTQTDTLYQLHLATVVKVGTTLTITDMRTYTNRMSDNQAINIMNNIVNQNLLINGNFQVWQRGTSFTAGASIWTYTADRFRVAPFTGTVTITKEATGLKTSGACILQYVLSADDLATLTGKVVTLTYCKNGTIQTSSTFTVSSKTVVNLTLAANDIINWLKLELGSVATGRVIRPYAEELNNCQSYYEIIGATNYGYIGNGIVFTGGNPYVVFPCKRKIQTTTFSVVATGTFRVVGYGTASITASDINNIADGATKRLQSNALSLVMTNITFTSWVNTAFVFGGNNTGSIAIDCEDYAN